MSWEIESLGNLLTESRIPAIIPNPDRRIRVKLNVAGVEKRPIENEIEGATKQFIRKSGQFIYGKQNFHKGAFGIIPPELDGFETSADIPSFDVREDCLPEWIFYFFKINNRYIELEKIARGMGSKRIHPEQLADIKIPLPTLDEQRFFIAKFHKFETLLYQVGDLQVYQLDLLKKLRQQIQQDAVQGKLVPQDPNDEPASELLERIKAEKEKLIQEKKIKKEKPLPEITPEEIPFEIPENWVWCRLGDICSKIGSGSTPRGSNYSKEGIPFFRSQNIYDEGLVFDDITFIDKIIHNQMDGTKVIASDILLNITGGSLGRCAIVSEDFDEGNVSQHVCIIRPIHICNSYIHKTILTPYFQKLIFNSTTGAGREGLPKYNLEQFVVPIPSLIEQKRIVLKVDQLMKLCDELEQTILHNQEYTQDLLQVALNEALEAKQINHL
jgi:type I restriction enzyme S subunit